MTPDDKILDLCRQYDVSPKFGRRLLPLVRTALGSDPEKRERLLGIVERSLAEEARRKRQLTVEPLSTKERELLRTVAGILHGWAPPRWMSDWK